MCFITLLNYYNYIIMESWIIKTSIITCPFMANVTQSEPYIIIIIILLCCVYMDILYNV